MLQHKYLKKIHTLIFFENSAKSFVVCCSRIKKVIHSNTFNIHKWIVLWFYNSNKPLQMNSFIKKNIFIQWIILGQKLEFYLLGLIHWLVIWAWTWLKGPRESFRCSLVLVIWVMMLRPKSLIIPHIYTYIVRYLHNNPSYRRFLLPGGDLCSVIFGREKSKLLNRQHGVSSFLSVILFFGSLCRNFVFLRRSGFCLGFLNVDLASFVIMVCFVG